ncbi:anti-sigma B factor antagonist [Allocatelliglobosispora scoriae]|uniref:Anti-sigma factor antagonist n=1 Tax=Allocatelliglobosispora scoriae TaxID=643052 RepID=A0A841C322_9ACTN|nr:STAS domain-containing protein [Allocatelliglobosispora scoriae]MBB5873442.1 anti-sigma B factor antagonist [Allocatelliglobosispora scoriae]
MPLIITDEEISGHAILAAAGDLDLTTAPQLTSAAVRLIETGTRDIIVDASRLEFCDSSGLSALLRIVGHLGPQGGRLAIVNPHPIVLRVLQLCGLDEAVLIADTVPSAILEFAGAR